MTFAEFTRARGKQELGELIGEHRGAEPMSIFTHQQLLGLLSEYLAVGGMPDAVRVWSETQDLRSVPRIHNTLLENYRQDFPKYARRSQVKYVDLVFQTIPRLLGRKFVYSHIAQRIKSRDLKAALELLSKGGVAHIVHHTNANGLPLGAEIKADLFKVIFLDVALTQALLGLEPGAWILDPKAQFVNRGPIIESFVGQEILA